MITIAGFVVVGAILVIGAPFDPEVVDQVLSNRARLAHSYPEIRIDPVGGCAAQSVIDTDRARSAQDGTLG